MDEPKEKILQKDRDGDTYLHSAVIQNKMDDVSRLLQCEFSKDLMKAQNNHGQNAMHLATFGGQINILSLLIKHGACVMQQDNNGDTPIHIATHFGKNECLRILCEDAAKESLQLANEKGDSPLHLALKSQNNIAVGLLLEKDVDINCKNTKTGETSLHCAVEKENQEIVKKLLDCGADVNVETGAGDTPLHFLITANQRDLAKLLLDKGGDIYKKNNDGKSPHDLADKTMQRFMVRNRQDRKKRRPKRPKDDTASVDQKTRTENVSSALLQSSKQPWILSNTGKKSRPFEDGERPAKTHDTVSRVGPHHATNENRFQPERWEMMLNIESDHIPETPGEFENISLPFTAYSRMPRTEGANGKVDVTSQVFARKEYGAGASNSKGTGTASFSAVSLPDEQQPSTQEQLVAWIKNHTPTAYSRLTNLGTQIVTSNSQSTNPCQGAINQNEDLSAAISMSMLDLGTLQQDIPMRENTPALQHVPGNDIILNYILEQFGNLSPNTTNAISQQHFSRAVSQTAPLQSNTSLQSLESSQVFHNNASIDSALSAMGVVDSKDTDLASQMPQLARHVEFIAQQFGLAPADVFLKLFSGSNTNN